MYRVPLDLDLGFCIGQSLNQVAIGKYDVQFRFHSGITFSLQGEGEVLHGGNVIATWTEGQGWSSLAFMRLLNSSVVRVLVPNDRTIELQFPQDLALRLYDSSDQFESIAVSASGRDTVHI